MTSPDPLSDLNFVGDPDSGPQGEQLREQMALLAEQVRRLGDRLTPAPPGRAPTPPRVAREPPGAPGPAFAALASDSVASIIAMAERTASEIRATAQREVRAIREADGGERSGPLEDLAAIRDEVRRLLEEIDRIEQAAAALRERAHRIAQALPAPSSERP